MENKKDLVEKRVEIVGLSENEATVVNAIIDKFDTLKKKDEEPLIVYRKRLESSQKELKYLTDVLGLIVDIDDEMVSETEKRIEIYNDEINKLNNAISHHENNIAYLDDYIKGVKSRIKETENEHKVVFEYDTEFFNTWLGLAVFFVGIE